MAEDVENRVHCVTKLKNRLVEVDHVGPDNCSKCDGSGSLIQTTTYQKKFTTPELFALNDRHVNPGYRDRVLSSDGRLRTSERIIKCSKCSGRGTIDNGDFHLRYHVIDFDAINLMFYLSNFVLFLINLSLLFMLRLGTYSSLIDDNADLLNASYAEFRYFRFNHSLSFVYVFIITLTFSCLCCCVESSKYNKTSTVYFYSSILLISSIMNTIIVTFYLFAFLISKDYVVSITFDDYKTILITSFICTLIWFPVSVVNYRRFDFKYIDEKIQTRKP